MYYSIEKTPFFDKWLKNLKDIRGRALILNRLTKMQFEGHFGDIASLSGELKEMRFSTPPATESILSNDQVLSFCFSRVGTKARNVEI